MPNTTQVAAIVITFISILMEVKTYVSKTGDLTLLMILSGLCLLLNDVEVIPKRYKGDGILRISFNFFIELVVCLLVIDVFLYLVWLKIEHFIGLFVNASSLGLLGSWTDFFSHAILFIIAAAFLFYCATVTNATEKISTGFSAIITNPNCPIHGLVATVPETEENSENHEETAT
jgi:hypothetical protein